MLNVQNNNQQSFGMAYRIIPNKNGKSATRLIAEKIQDYRQPQFVEDEFFKIAENLKNLKTKVFTDGEDVILEHPVTGKQFSILDCNPWMAPNSDGKTINYAVQTLEKGKIVGESINIPVYYNQSQNLIGKPAWDANYMHEGIMRKHVIALEVGKEFDRQAAIKTTENIAKVNKQNAIKETESRLYNLFA